MTQEDIRASLETNVQAPIQITACAVRGMKRRNLGHVVNIGSIAGLHTMISSLYGATKSAIHQFICPGRVETEFYGVASGNPEGLAKMADTEIRSLQPEDIARTILFALDAPMRVNVSTIEILPVEQVVGGVRMAPCSWENKGE